MKKAHFRNFERRRKNTKLEDTKSSYTRKPSILANILTGLILLYLGVAVISSFALILHFILKAIL